MRHHRRHRHRRRRCDDVTSFSTFSSFVALVSETMFYCMLLFLKIYTHKTKHTVEKKKKVLLLLMMMIDVCFDEKMSASTNEHD
jgi:hypothetical protein